MTRIAHINVQITDAPTSIRFYQRLGLELVGCLRLDPMVLYYLAPPDSAIPTIELTDNPALAERNPGSGHFALEVDDLDELLERLAQQGIVPFRGPFRPGDKPDLRVAFIRDPDGTAIELCDGAFPAASDDPPEHVAATIRGTQQ